MEWKGFRFPARLLTAEERETLTPACGVCGLPAVVVELCVPLTEKFREISAVAIPEDDARMLCPFHTELDIPQDLQENAYYDFFTQLTKPTLCPKHEYKKLLWSCVFYQPVCVNRCDPLKKALAGTKMNVAQERVAEGRRIHTLRSKPDDPNNPHGT